MSTFLTPSSRLENVETPHVSQWSIQHLLRKSCEVTQALGAVLMTQVDGCEPRYTCCHRVAKSLAEKIIDQFKHEPFLPGKTSCILRIIGMGTVLCVSVSTLVNRLHCGRWNQARLVVMVPAERQMGSHAVSLLEDVLHDIGLALVFYQRHSAYFTRFDEQAGLKTCLICENIHSSTGQWLRWNEFLVRQVGLSLSHTLCCNCAAFYYPECTGAKNGSQGLQPVLNSLFNLPHTTGCVEVCAVCEDLKTEAGVWVRWDEYIRLLGGGGFTHTLCIACSGSDKMDAVSLNGRSALVEQVA